MSEQVWLVSRQLKAGLIFDFLLYFKCLYPAVPLMRTGTTMVSHEVGNRRDLVIIANNAPILGPKEYARQFGNPCFILYEAREDIRGINFNGLDGILFRDSKEIDLDHSFKGFDPASGSEIVPAYELLKIHLGEPRLDFVIWR